MDVLCRVPADDGLTRANNFLTPLGFAVETRTVESVKILLDFGVDFDHVCEVRNQDTPLRYTIVTMLNHDPRKEDYKTIFDLLVTKAIEEQRPPKHRSLLHAMALCPDRGLITYVVPRLIDCGVKLESKNKHKNTPLLEAIEKSNSLFVKELIKENCSLNHVSLSSDSLDLLRMISSLHPNQPVELCIYLSKVEAVKLKMYFGPNARPSMYMEGDLLGNIVSID